MITNEYRTHINPVAVRAAGPFRCNAQKVGSQCIPRFWDTLSLSAGRVRSFTPAATKHHFIIGAQKNTVLGPNVFAGDKNVSLCESLKSSPAGWFMNEENLETLADAAGPDMCGEVEGSRVLGEKRNENLYNVIHVQS